MTLKREWENEPFRPKLCQLCAKHTHVYTYGYVCVCVCFFSQLTHVFHIFYFKQLSKCEKNCFTIWIAHAKNGTGNGTKRRKAEDMKKKAGKRRWAVSTIQVYTVWNFSNMLNKCRLLTMLSHIENAHLCVCMFSLKIAKECFFFNITVMPTWAWTMHHTQRERDSAWLTEREKSRQSIFGIEKSIKKRIQNENTSRKIT